MAKSCYGPSLALVAKRKRARQTAKADFLPPQYLVLANARARASLTRPASGERVVFPAVAGFADQPSGLADALGLRPNTVHGGAECVKGFVPI
jgi:hypothetical protein